MNIPKVSFVNSQFASSGLEIFSLESLQQRLSKLDHNPEAPHRVKFHLLIYIQQGMGTHFIDFNHYSFDAGSFIFVNKNQVQAFDFSDVPIGYCIAFTQQFKDSISANIRLPNFLSSFSGLNRQSILNVSGGLKQSLELQLQEISAISGEHEYDLTISRLLLSTLFLKLYREMPVIFSSELSAQQNSRFIQFQTLVTENFTEMKDASDYAGLMGITYKTLNKLCKLSVNRTPKQLINEHLVLEAKRRLVIENVQIKQLAFELGFDDVSNFTKYFKKQTLQTPKQFKKNHKGS